MTQTVEKEGTFKVVVVVEVVVEVVVIVICNSVIVVIVTDTIFGTLHFRRSSISSNSMCYQFFYK